MKTKPLVNTVVFQKALPRCAAAPLRSSPTLAHLAMPGGPPTRWAEDGLPGRRHEKTKPKEVRLESGCLVSSLWFLVSGFLFLTWILLSPNIFVVFRVFFTRHLWLLVCFLFNLFVGYGINSDIVDLCEFVFAFSFWERLPCTYQTMI